MWRNCCTMPLLDIVKKHLVFFVTSVVVLVSYAIYALSQPVYTKSDFVKFDNNEYIEKCFDSDCRMCFDINLKQKSSLSKMSFDYTITDTETKTLNKSLFLENIYATTKKINQTSRVVYQEYTTTYNKTIEGVREEWDITETNYSNFTIIPMNITTYPYINLNDIPKILNDLPIDSIYTICLFGDLKPNSEVDIYPSIFGFNYTEYALWSNIFNFTIIINSTDKTIYNLTGNFTDLSFDIDNRYVYINSTIDSDNNNLLNGTFISQVFDGTIDVEWRNISWTQEVCYGCEIPNYLENESSVYRSPLNSSGIIFSIHLNNDSTIGEDTNTFVSTSVKNMTGRCSGTKCPSITNNGMFGNALVFGEDLVDRMVSFGNADEVNSFRNFSVSLWVLHNRSDTGGVIANYISKATGGGAGTFQFGQNDVDVYFILQTGTGTVISTGVTAVKVGQWTHVVGTHEGKNMRLYINGNLNDTTVRNGYFAGGTQNLTLGSRIGSGDEVFMGWMDEVAIWNRTLADNEIMNLYKRGIGKVNFSARTCDDAECDTETFTVLNNNTPPQKLALPNNRYFQYQFVMSRLNITLNLTNKIAYKSINESPQVYNVTIEYNRSGNTPPAGGSCTYGGSGNWIIDPDDLCRITTNTNILGNALIIDEATDTNKNVGVLAVISGVSRMDIRNGARLDIGQGGVIT